MDEGVTVNNIDISRLLDRTEGIGKLIVSDPVAFNEPLTVSRRKAVCHVVILLMGEAITTLNMCFKEGLLAGGSCVMPLFIRFMEHS